MGLPDKIHKKVEPPDNIHKNVGPICPGLVYYFFPIAHMYTYLDWVDVALWAELSEVCTSIDVDHIAHMVKLTIGSFQDAIKGFAAALVVENPNTEFWWDYMTVVSILLCFTRAQRDGSRDIHLYEFKPLLPFPLGTTMLVTPYGVMYTWLICRFSRQTSSMSSRQATSW